MEPQMDQREEMFSGIFSGIDVNAESWRYKAIRQLPLFKRPSSRFSRGMPIVCEAFGIWAEGLIAEVRRSKNNKSPALMICLKFGVSSLCGECDVSCGDRYWAMADWGGVLTKEDLKKNIGRSRSLVVSILGNYGIEAYRRQATQLLRMIEGLEARARQSC